jgi:hypothetical protein
MSIREMKLDIYGVQDFKPRVQFPKAQKLISPNENADERSGDLMSAGIVYVLINEAMPGLVKIGFTRDELVIRIKGLDSTSVPLPFECFCAIEVGDCRKVEQLVHDVFGDQRVRSNREFFRVSPERVRSALMLTGGVDVTPAESDIISTVDDRQAIQATRRRAENATFGMIGIAPGTTLTFSKDPSRTCVVKDEKKVEMEGETLSVSKSALKILHGLGYTWRTVNGWAYWSYQGKTLDEHFLALEDEAA